MASASFSHYVRHLRAVPNGIISSAERPHLDLLMRMTSRLTHASVAALVLSVLQATPIRGQVLVLLNQQTRAVKKYQDGDTTKKGEVLPDGKSFTIEKEKQGKTVLFIVDGTNSAYSTCVSTQTPASVPDLDSLKSFLSSLSPYPTALLAVMGGHYALPLKTPTTDETTLQQDVSDINALIFTDPKGLIQSHLAGLKFLQLHRNDVGSKAAMLSTDIANATSVQCAAGHCTWDVPSRIADLVNKLRLDRSKVTPSAANKELVQGADSLLAQSDQILTTAYATEAFLFPAAQALGTITCDSIADLAWNEGKQVAITVAPRTAPIEIARLANGTPWQFTTTALPHYYLRPLLGLALIGAPTATYPTFSTATGTNNQIQIVEGNRQDSRFNYGLSLGLVPWFLDFRDTKAHFASFPELTINPTGSTKAIGVGWAISWYYVKVGYGALWTEHPVLSSGAEGTVLTDASLLRTHQAYNGAQYYLSFSILGIPPFTSGNAGSGGGTPASTTDSGGKPSGSKGGKTG